MHINPGEMNIGTKLLMVVKDSKWSPKVQLPYKRNIQKVSPYPKLTQNKTEEPPRVLHAFNTYSEATCDRWQLCWKG